MKQIPVLFGIYLSAIVGLLLYSFTQIDLGLTITRASFWQGFQQGFQYIGYFNRPLSTTLFVIVVTVLFISYVVLVRKSLHKHIKPKQLWIVIGITCGLLFVSYTAFSHDIFNYMFDAKIVTHYQENPYERKALDYPGDPMLSFMHWTHRTYPYGPLWLALTVPVSFLGGNFLLPTYVLFKALAVAAFFGTALYIGKIALLDKKTLAPAAIAAFALQPLVVIESLVTAHNDIVMVFFAVAATYFLLQKKYVLAVLFLFISIGIKFATVFLLPVFIAYIVLQKQGKGMKVGTLITLCLLSMLIPLVLVSLRTQFQPWYLLYLLPFVALLVHKWYVFVPVTILSVFALIQYIPYLYLGNWDPRVPMMLTTMTILGVIAALLTIGIGYLYSKK